jgi:hypothetical protein
MRKNNSIRKEWLISINMGTNSLVDMSITAHPMKIGIKEMIA